MTDEPHPEVQELLEMLDTMGAPAIHELDPVEARGLLASTLAPCDPVEAVGDVTDRTIDGPAGDLPVRIYTPAGDGPFPVVVYFHGGGFVLGGLDTHDDTCRVLCTATEAIVVSVDYRLAPEHPFPAAVEDAYAATEWVADNAASIDGDPGHVVVAGDSAGGTLAAVVAIRARDRAERGESVPEIAYQILLYPATDPAGEYPSREENGAGYFLTAPDLRYFRNHYLEHDLHAANRYAFPMEACGLAGLPPATVVTAGFDPLRDEGRAYADRLDADGVDVTYRNYEDMIHGFVSMLGQFEIARAREAIDDVAADLEEALSDE
jgi:acetyl esterase